MCDLNTIRNKKNRSVYKNAHKFGRVGTLWKLIILLSWLRGLARTHSVNLKTPYDVGNVKCKNFIFAASYIKLPF